VQSRSLLLGHGMIRAVKPRRDVVPEITRVCPIEQTRAGVDYLLVLLYLARRSGLLMHYYNTYHIYFDDRGMLSRKLRTSDC